MKGRGTASQPAVLHGSGGYDRIVSVAAVAKVLGEHDIIEPAAR